MSIPSHILDGLTIESITWDSVGAEATNVITAVLKVVQPTGGIPLKLPPIVVYTATLADGVVVEIPSGGITEGTRGTIAALTTAAELVTVTPDDNGMADVVVTETTTDTMFLIAVNPATGAIIASTVLSFD